MELASKANTTLSGVNSTPGQVTLPAKDLKEF